MSGALRPAILEFADGTVSDVTWTRDILYYNHTLQPYITVNLNYYRDKYTKDNV